MHDGEALDLSRIRAEFPALSQKIRGRPLVYLDNAATTQKPLAVIEAIRRAYVEDCANIHRGIHTLSQRATDAFEAARKKVQRFLGAPDPCQVIFTSGTTASINLVMQTFGRKNVGPGDEVLITGLEHHSNIVPWQMLCEERGARLRVAPLDGQGRVPMEGFVTLLGPRTKIAAISHVSNALGTVNPVAEMIRQAHERGVPVLVDGAQAAPHLSIDVAALDCDFYCFSGHKLFGPTGVGVLYGRKSILQAMPPWQGGGEMIASVTFEKTSYAPLPHKLEAGTPHIAGVIGLGAAIDWLEGLDRGRVSAHEHRLLAYAVERLSEVPGLRLVGNAPERAGAVSFVLGEIHAHDVGTVLDREGVAVRTGHHCAQPVMAHFSVPATARASFAVYNTEQEVDALVRGLLRVREVFR